jgi:hypothetical protein
MLDSDLRGFRRWFSRYVRSFAPRSEEERRNFLLKERHTREVLRNAERIAREEGLSREKARVAAAAALLHDVGRFPQLARYGTFRDASSVNHGLLGARVIEEEGLLAGLPEAERDVILAVVRYHNAFRVPDLGRPEAELCLRLIRDADKLDIWRVFSEWHDTPPGERSAAANLGLSPKDACTDAVLDAVKEGRIPSIDICRTGKDYVLVQLSWVHDLTFRTSFRILLKRDVLGRLGRVLPDGPAVREALERLAAYVKVRAAGP